MKSLENIINKTISKAKNGLKSLAFTGLIGLALAGGAREAKAVNSNSIIRDNIEYYIQTDKSVYNLGENVEMMYRVKNLGSEDVSFDFSFGPEYRQCNFIVGRNGESIWDTTGWPVLWVVTIFTLNPLESREYTQLWDMTYNNGEEIVPDNYNMTGVFNYDSSHERYVPVSVSMDVIPEPSSLLLMGGGLVTLLSHRRKK